MQEARHLRSFNTGKNPLIYKEAALLPVIKNGNSATKPTLRIQADDSLSDMKAQEDELF